MKKLFVVIIMLFLYSMASAGEQVTIDTADIQEYRGKIGKWFLIDTREALSGFVKKFSITLKDVYAINKIRNKRISYDYYFIPYSEKYLLNLKRKGKDRIITSSSINEYIWPINDVIKITSVLGFRNKKFHPGLDIPAARGEPVLASMEGVVAFSGYAEGYGRCIVLNHRNNFRTRYSHNSVNLVKKGDFIKKGQIVALVGSTGNSTGNHLHFEIRCKRIPLDPLDFLPQKSDLQTIHTLKNWK